MTARWLCLELCLPPQVLPQRCGGGAGCPQGQGTCPEVRTRLGAPAMPRVDFGCPAPARCQLRPSTRFAACHHTPSRLQSRTPLGMNLPGPSVSLRSLGDTPMAVGSQSSHTQTSVQWTCSMSGHPLPPASAVFQRLSWRDEAELCVLALFSGSGLEGCGCLRRGHTSYLLPGGPPCPTLPLPPAPQVQLQGFSLCLEDTFRPPAPHRRALRARSCQQVSPGAVCLLSW